MKKYLLSSIVILSFIGYSFYQRASGQQAISALPMKKMTTIPVSPTPTDLPTPTPTDTPTPTSSVIKKESPTSTPIPPAPTSTPVPTQKPTSAYKDGQYTGDAADAFYGNIQVQVTISSGKITDIQFLQYPNSHGHSIEINQQADPMLAQEAIQAQSANVNIISGATDSSQAFIQSMASALNKAKS